MDEDFYEEVSYAEARKRNLLIAIVKVFSAYNFDMTQEFSKEEISSLFFL